LISKPSEFFKDYKTNLMPVGAITIADDREINNQIKQNKTYIAGSMYVLPKSPITETTDTFANHAYCELTDFNHISINTNKTYTKFINYELATLLKYYFVPEYHFLELLRVADDSVSIKELITKAISNKCYLPHVPFNLPFNANVSGVIQNPNWVIRSESLIDEKILGN
jgi:hypothetical protein